MDSLITTDPTNEIKRLYVGGLSEDTTTLELQKRFGVYGNVLKVEIPEKSANGTLFSFFQGIV